jgi:hypothetical protein
VTGDPAPIRDVVLRVAEHRFVIERDGQLAELVYERDGDRLVLEHTGVPTELERRGLGSALVQAAVRWAVAEGLTVVPRCPFARWWLRRHPDVAASARVDWTTRTR